MTIQNAPPGLDYDRDKKFSKVLVFFLGVVLSFVGFLDVYVFSVRIFF